MTSARRAHWVAVLMVVTAAVLWSTSGLVFRLLEETDQWRIVFWRSGLLAPFVLALIVARAGRRSGAAFRAADWHGLLAGAFLGAAFTLWILALGATSVANAAFLLCCSPAVTVVLAWLLLGERLRVVNLLAVAGVLAGTFIINVGGMSGGRFLGNLYAILTAVGFAAYTIIARKRQDVDMQPAVLFAAVFSALVAAVVLGGDVGISARDMALCVVLGVGQVGLGLVLFTAGARHLPAVELTLLSLIEVVLGPVWVWLLLGESVPARTLIGGLVMLAAVALPGFVLLRRGPVAASAG